MKQTALRVSPPPRAPLLSVATASAVSRSRGGDGERPRAVRAGAEEGSEGAARGGVRAQALHDAELAVDADGLEKLLN